MENKYGKSKSRLKKVVKQIIMPGHVDVEDFGVRHQLSTYALSMDDDPNVPTPELIKTCLAAAEQALTVNLDDIAARTADQDSPCGSP